MPSCNTYCLTCVSLTLAMGYLLMAAPPDLERGVAPLGPLAPVQPPLLGLGLLLPAAAPDLGHGVAPLGHSCTVAAWHSRPLPLTWTWGTSSWPLPLGHGVLSASAPDFGCGVAHLAVIQVCSWFLLTWLQKLLMVILLYVINTFQAYFVHSLHHCWSQQFTQRAVVPTWKEKLILVLSTLIQLNLIEFTPVLLLKFMVTQHAGC